ncbi:MAG TPA: HD domain-containing phosphohydrolase [Thermodesulfovibrionales bacterium]|nr:HD domain-containing phosphohydrolase [Thermodesulfovibrionales bacterium]
MNSERAPVKILFVDDEENVLRSLRRLFIDEDFDIFTANSGGAGLEIIRGHEISVIISDQKMPEMSGSEFLEKSRELSPDSVRIVLTGYADVNAAISSINKGGAYRYITKPWNDGDLVLTVKDAADKYRLIKENKYLTELTKKQNEELKHWNSQLEIMVQEQTIDIQNRNKDLQKLNEQHQKNFKSVIEAFSGLLEMRDKSLSNHSKNVAFLARQTSKAMSLTEKEVNNVLVAALLHDIGKIGVPDSILLKREEDYSDYEKNEYRLHPVRGQVALASLEGFHEIGLTIRHHHEHVDGSGFVDGIRKAGIPLGSRIIAVADAVDRIANSGHSMAKNNYRKAIEEIEFYLHKKYDGDIFPYIRQVVDEKMRTVRDHDYSYEMEVHPGRLVSGMVLSRDVRSGSGLLILAQGVILDQKIISAIQRYYEIDPPANGVFVIKSNVLQGK